MFMEEITLQDALEARREEGLEEGRERERVNAIRRMLGIGLTEGQILGMEYTAGEIERARTGIE